MCFMPSGLVILSSLHVWNIWSQPVESRKKFCPLDVCGCGKFHQFKFPFIDKELSGLKSKAQIFRRKTRTRIRLAFSILQAFWIGVLTFRICLSFFCVTHLCSHTVALALLLLLHTRVYETCECNEMCVNLCAYTHTHTDVMCTHMHRKMGKKKCSNRLKMPKND